VFLEVIESEPMLVSLVGDTFNLISQGQILVLILPDVRHDVKEFRISVIFSDLVKLRVLPGPGFLNDH
jgi:hypothetical protein